MKKLIIMSIILLLAGSSVSGKDFNLNSQIGEEKSQEKAISNTGIRLLNINPAPRRVIFEDAPGLNMQDGFRVNDKSKAFSSDLDFITHSSKGKAITIDFGSQLSAKKGMEAIPGAYNLTVGNKGIEITGYDESGAFYGLQTLRQLLENFSDTLPSMQIQDWPALSNRGVVEGFYGTPWSHEVRLSLIDFYGRNKMNTYIYGPKDDPFHSSPHWRSPYPKEEAERIRELVDASRRARVNFVWAIHPGKDIRWNEEDYANLLSKFDHMYDLGVRSFALFFDDIEGEGTDPHRQAALVNDLTRDFVMIKGDVAPLMICPTDYSQMWANPTDEGTLAVYGRELTPEANVFWTGSVVCSDLTPETLDFINSRIKRPTFYWWNFPVSDYCRNYILQGPAYGLDPTLTSGELAGIVSNPMEHGEASKLAIYGVADYAWNPSSYSPLDNWERGIRLLMPGAPEAYRTFAIHNCDTETGYRRDESWETETFSIDDYTPAQFNALRAEFERVKEAPSNIRNSGANPQLLKELEPWLVEFEKLGERGLRTLDLIKIYESGDDSVFMKAYEANLMTEEDREAYDLHKVGTMKLQPFYENSMDDMYFIAYERMTGKVPPIYLGIGSYENLPSSKGKLMTDNDDSTYYSSGTSQKDGDWIGLDLRASKEVNGIDIKQGRNSVDDSDFFDHCIVEVSKDGDTWTPLTQPIKDSYEIQWQGNPVDARYVRIRRLDSSRRNWASIRSFRVFTLD